MYLFVRNEFQKFQKNRHHSYETLYKVQVDFKWTCITPISPGIFQGIQKGSLERRSAPRVGLCSQHTLNSVLEHTMAQDALTFCIDFKPVPFTYFHKISLFWEFYQIWSQGPRFRSQKKSSTTYFFRILISSFNL